ncbi:MAG: chemotaxis protein CheW [Burkholderiaceae bacterium]|nr:chemotaxis protein CheW [Burkholderiaceae bacterium]
MKPDSMVVDWEAVKRRLAATERMLADDFVPSAATQAAILEQRARDLARVPELDIAGDEREVLEFSIADKGYAFETEWVSEIVVLGELTALPCTPDFVRGIVSIRGRIVPAVDLRRFFGVAVAGIVDFHHIIVLCGGGMEFGVLADKIDGVSRLDVNRLQRTAASGMLGEFTMGGMAKNAVLLDAEKLLRDRRIVVDQGAPQ